LSPLYRIKKQGYKNDFTWSIYSVGFVTTNLVPRCPCIKSGLL